MADSKWMTWVKSKIKVVGDYMNSEAIEMPYVKETPPELPPLPKPKLSINTMTTITKKVVTYSDGTTSTTTSKEETKLDEEAQKKFNDAMAEMDTHMKECNDLLNKMTGTMNKLFDW